MWSTGEWRSCYQKGYRILGQPGKKRVTYYKLNFAASFKDSGMKKEKRNNAQKWLKIVILILNFSRKISFVYINIFAVVSISDLGTAAYTELPQLRSIHIGFLTRGMHLVLDIKINNLYLFNWISITLNA